MNLRCYCCGTPLGQTFYLMVSGPENKSAFDRVFLVLPEHTENFEGEATMLLVTRGPE